MVALAVREGQTLEVPLGEALLWKHPGAELGGLIRQGVALEAARCCLLLQATHWVQARGAALPRNSPVRVCYCPVWLQ